jgi:hypothetical protein
VPLYGLYESCTGDYESGGNRASQDARISTEPPLHVVLGAGKHEKRTPVRHPRRKSRCPRIPF